MMDRESLIKKVRALMAKTVDNGCTEAEAMAAAEKVAALMRDHSLSETVLEMENASIGVKFNIRSIKAKVCAAIAFSTNCAVLHMGEGREKTALYIGYAPGPQIACYLHDVLHRAVDSAIKDFRADRFYETRRTTKTKRKAVEDFTDGMVQGLCSRLIRLFKSSINEEKGAKARQALAEMFPRTKTVRTKESKPRFLEANLRGESAARKVNISQGVAEQRRPLLLGKADA
ncbi:DUF2786 domain-containing protein [Agrobacterium vitis]|uniref:DUF7168 domain-containing protein n=1 Tax=Allorhizobium ampelinum TaxID=3025782 RepID=UPI001F20EF29|nr:DUF2786 domain-containing protein [Allorhizobium ampelinum]MCF1485061.1 DUF2786 domain-containing protein [Allorhizobium ampelinum]